MLKEEGAKSCLALVHRKKNKIWTGGYFVSTIGEVSEDKIIDYIKNQG